MLVERDLTRIHLGVACPMANEAETAVSFIDSVLEHAAEVGRVTMFVVLDRVSRDNTLDLLRAHEAVEPRLKVVWAPENRCLVDAYVRGYREAVAAGCDWILEIDAGFSHDPREIPSFLKHIPEEWDCVFGSRYREGGSIGAGSLKRRIVSRGGTLLSNLLLGTGLSDMTSGFELFSRPAMELLLERGIRSRAHFFQTEIRAYCHGLRITEVPIHYSMPSPRLRGGAVVEAFRELYGLWKLRRAGRLLLKPPAALEET
jgi:dolichol-phosphate mannosyltransferase